MFSCKCSPAMCFSTLFSLFSLFSPGTPTGWLADKRADCIAQARWLHTHSLLIQVNNNAAAVSYSRVINDTCHLIFKHKHRQQHDQHKLLQSLNNLLHKVLHEHWPVSSFLIKFTHYLHPSLLWVFPTDHMKREWFAATAITETQEHRESTKKHDRHKKRTSYASSPLYSATRSRDNDIRTSYTLREKREIVAVTQYVCVTIVFQFCIRWKLKQW